MRYSPLILPLSLLVVACAGGQSLDKNSAQYAQVTTLASKELKCADDDDIDVRSVGDSRVVVTACKQTTSYVYACRQPGPRELAYVSNTPVPPTEESIEAAGEETATDAPAQVIELRQQQIKYTQDLVATRLADVQEGAAKGYAPRHKMPDLPKFWLDQECQYMHEKQ